MRQKLLLHLLLHTGRMLDERVRSELSAYDLHQGQARLLDALLNTGPMNIGQLAIGLQVAQPTITSMLQRMEGNGFVRRVQDASDGRVMMMHLTAKGRKAALTVHEVWQAVEADLTALLSSDELAAAHDILLLIRNRLGGQSPGFILKQKEDIHE
jgi:DNA-binding MarR family transcriptional regulator